MITVCELNHAISENAKSYLLNCDHSFSLQLHTIANEIYQNRKEKPIILLSGPSGAGKTTTALLLEKILDSRGAETHTLSLDNYFYTLSKEQSALAAAGKFDLESPKRIDTDLLNQQLKEIYQGNPVRLPRFNFVTATQEFGEMLHRRPEDLVILEGTHALNPEVITLPHTHISSLFISVDSTVTHENNRLSRKKIRLLRRIIRDKLFRGRNLFETLNLYPNVKAGESAYVLPYRASADYAIDTFHPYELNVYRSLLAADLPLLQSSPITSDIASFFAHLLPLEPEAVSKSALIREFIGQNQSE